MKKLEKLYNKIWYRNFYLFYERSLKSLKKKKKIHCFTSKKFLHENYELVILAILVFLALKL